jgi:branched-chain amino acid transport system substrate-binding protein
MEFREVFQKTNGSATTDAFSAYSFDGWQVLTDAITRAKGQPGTPEFRQSLLSAIASSKEVVGTHGVFNFKPGNIYGVDERARVIVVLEHGHWKLSP